MRRVQRGLALFNPVSLASFEWLQPAAREPPALSDKRNKAGGMFSHGCDVLAYVAFALAPQTRAERAAMAKTEVHQQFTDRQQAFVDFVLAQYVKEGVEELDA